ncbi:hypothetical protein BdWA1_003269 [Babesia duncani]|uniref:Uncharacterized protein n=1 Tax=Babesia duncani TaxID=323732 RepID=A0AAD9PIS7_9APIC|nr:hypothetical protein BdWA1_003269 [Babesia duncani]
MAERDACRCYGKLLEIQEFIKDDLRDCKNSVWDAQIANFQRERDLLLLRNNELRRELTTLKSLIRQDPFVYQRLYTPENDLSKPKIQPSRSSKDMYQQALFYAVGRFIKMLYSRIVTGNSNNV